MSAKVNKTKTELYLRMGCKKYDILAITGVTMSHVVVNPQEIERRRKSIASIRHSQRMEGGDVTPYAAQLFERYINGELSLDEVGEALKTHHRA